MPAFPRKVPDSLTGIADPIISILGSLVPAVDAERISSALSQMDVLEVCALGLEVVLPPHSPACDLSVLMAPRTVPDFAKSASPVLASLATSAGAFDSTWWELDTSVEPSPVGVFIRSTEVDALSLVREAAAPLPALAQAVSSLEAIIDPYWQGGGRLIGFFPDRAPAPVAAGLLPNFTRTATDVIEELSSQVTISVDSTSPLISHLTQHMDGSALAIAVDANNRASVSWEGSFWEREQAMVEGRWSPALEPDPAWGDAAESLPALLAVQGIHTFDALPTIRLLSGIDHIKVGPNGRVKAYVGAHIVMPGQR